MTPPSTWRGSAPPVIAGLAAGALAKALDEQLWLRLGPASSRTVLALAYASSMLGPWVIALAVIVRRASSRRLAITGSVAFFIAMCLGYYLVAWAVGLGTVVVTVAAFWLILSLTLVPALAATMTHRGPGRRSVVRALGWGTPAAVVVGEMVSRGLGVSILMDRGTVDPPLVAVYLVLLVLAGLVVPRPDRRRTILAALPLAGVYYLLTELVPVIFDAFWRFLH